MRVEAVGVWNSMGVLALVEKVWCSAKSSQYLQAASCQFIHARVYRRREALVNTVETAKSSSPQSIISKAELLLPLRQG